MFQTSTRVTGLFVAAFLFFAKSESASAQSCIPVFTSQPGDAATCPNGSAVFSAAATGSGITYRWQVNDGTGFVNLNDGPMYANTATTVLSINGAPNSMYGTLYRLSATNSCGTTYSNMAHLTFRTFWTGGSSNWQSASNWSCGIVPDALTDVAVLPGGTAPVISSASIAHNVIVYPGASLSLAAGSALTLSGDLTVQGSFAAGTGSTTTFNSPTSQLIAGVTYSNLVVAGGSNKSITGDATVNGTLTFSSGRILLGNYNLNTGIAATIAGANSSNYVLTNGTGGLKRPVGPSTGSVLYPVGTPSSYNPFTFSNSGTPDNFKGRVIDGFYSSYVNDIPQGPISNNQKVNRTWFLSEDVIGGSNATLNVQWNASDELNGFNRSVSTLSHYTGGAWDPMAITPCGGGGPYNIARTGITSFSPFGVDNIPTPLALKLLSFSGNREKEGVLLRWTAIADHADGSFDVERSADGRSFSTVGQLRSRDAGTNSYTFTDVTAPASGKLYYRLNMKEQSGSAVYSETLVLNQRTESAQPVFALAANPVQSAEAQLRVQGGVAGELRVGVLDLNGRVWFNQSYETAGGDQLLPLDVKVLPPGYYLLRVRNGNSTETIRMDRR